MKEFGSDFHFISDYTNSRNTLRDYYPNAILLANGRHCIRLLMHHNSWKRLWVPEYFCYEVLDSLKDEINFAYYKDFPSNNNYDHLSSLEFHDGDAILVVNYFGLKNLQSLKGFPVPIIEDHSHDLIGPWAVNSQADWCIASLRKSLPIPEGGMLWSPKGHHLDIDIEDTCENETLASKRWMAMELKTKYLMGVAKDKGPFRNLFLKTEEEMDTLKLSLLDERSCDYLSKFNIESWYSSKKENLILLIDNLNPSIKVFSSSDSSLNVFSLILLFNNKEERNRIRKDLISNSVYTAILWTLPEEVGNEAKSFCERMLSVHCDGRYSTEDIKELASRINRIIIG